MVAKGQAGSLYLSPWVSAAAIARRDMLALARQFGLTPSARTSLKVEAPEKKESLAEVLFSKVQAASK
jgi:phage terminase small subunit